METVGGEESPEVVDEAAVAAAGVAEEELAAVEDQGGLVLRQHLQDPLLCCSNMHEANFLEKHTNFVRKTGLKFLKERFKSMCSRWRLTLLSNTAFWVSGLSSLVLRPTPTWIQAASPPTRNTSLFRFFFRLCIDLVKSNIFKFFMLKKSL